jgi:hypothetical protein
MPPEIEEIGFEPCCVTGLGARRILLVEEYRYFLVFLSARQVGR